MGTHLRVLSESYMMDTNMAGFRCFSKIFAIWTKVAFELEGILMVNVADVSDRPDSVDRLNGLHVYSTLASHSSRYLHLAIEWKLIKELIICRI